jgi:CRISPR-associated protein Cmr4
MTSNARLYFLVCRSPLHLGCGDSLGAIDKPIKRHVVTKHPLVPGSAIKGCLKEPARAAWHLDGVQLSEIQHEALLSGADKTSMLSPQDAALLLLPVACWAGGWAWVTSPAILHRLRRTASRAALVGLPDEVPAPALEVASTPLDSVLITRHQGTVSVVLAEELLDCQPEKIVAEWADWLALHAMRGEAAPWVAQFKKRFVVVHDEVFDWLATVGTDVRARNKIGPDGVAADHHLWREECVPEDTVFIGTLSVQPVPEYADVLTERQALRAPAACDLQLGGKGSVGYGWVSFRPVAVASVEPSE